MYTVHIIQPTSNCQQMVLSHGRQADRQAGRQTGRQTENQSVHQTVSQPICL